jgi:hypothetical protein
MKENNALNAWTRLRNRKNKQFLENTLSLNSPKFVKKEIRY